MKNPSTFLFPKVQSSVLPNPSRFFASHLLSSPLPTNSFFQNFVLNNSEQAEYIHPYLIKSASSSLSLCYPSRVSTTSFINQTFAEDLTISTPNSSSTHIISSFNDLSVTLEIPPNLRFFLVRGSPFLTFSVLNAAPLNISTIHAILSLTSNSSLKKHKVRLNNSQTWMIYSSSPLKLSRSISSLSASDFSGIVRIALLLEPDCEALLDRFSSCYAVSGEAVLSRPFSVEYKWRKKGRGELLLLAHPLQLRLLSTDECDAVVLDHFRYNSIDGELVGVVGDSWLLRTDPISVTWNSARGLEEKFFPKIVSALREDVKNLTTNPITTTSSYFYGKLIARAARLALIAEEVGCFDVIPAVKEFLEDAITPWLNGSFLGNGFLYDSKWGGVVTKQGSLDSKADFGFGIYNDHHYHIGYFLHAIAVLTKINTSWGWQYRPQAYSMMADFMNLGRRSKSNYPKLRCFDPWMLHSWASGLTEFADGRNQESTSEAVNAYYSAALMGMSYGDVLLASVGSTLAAFEMQAAGMWWHVKEEKSLYEDDFSRENRMVGILWNNKRVSELWFAPANWRECRTGIQVLPLLPITEALFSDIEFVRELVKWTEPALQRKGVEEGWKGFLHALEALYDRKSALNKTTSLTGFDSGNSLTNLLWWIYSRRDAD